MTDTPALRLDGVSRTFGGGDAAVKAVDDVSLDVGAGELVLVMGPSGSGKTTLLAMCGGLLRPTSGHVWIGDTEVTALSERSLPELRLRRIGFIFQSAHLLANLTGSENVQIVLNAAGVPRAQANARVRDLLGSLRMTEHADRRPDELSGGERQRVAIARALANDPPLLFADEPTANLDSRAGYELMHTLELLAKEQGKTVVVVTHDSRIADVADRVVWMEDGRVSEQPPGSGDTVVDPVCRMSIDPTRAAGSRWHGDGAVHFCSQICIDRYDANPAGFAPSASPGRRPSG